MGEGRQHWPACLQRCAVLCSARAVQRCCAPSPEPALPPSLSIPLCPPPPCPLPAGRSWMVPGKERRREAEACFLPKRHIHTWSGHSKGVNAIRCGG